MTVRVSFADLTHMGQVVAANTFPLGITMVASYAQQELGGGIELEVFKYPDDLANYLDGEMPKIACFSSFAWNIRLAHEYAKRIKEISPETITVFGGPHFPGSPEEQKKFLRGLPAIDCYFEFEGEISFVTFFRALQEIDFDWPKFRDEKREIQNIRYMSGNTFVAAPLAEKIKDPNIIPSPHLNGVSDKFYDGILIPMIQSTRGCPYQCAFCWEGGPYFRKIKRFDQDRVHKELHYIGQRVGDVPDLCIVDANLGMFPEDMETAKEVLAIQKKHKNQWPRTILAATAKNHKERTIEIIELLGDTLPPTGAVQSTDPDVLANIKRKNPSMEALSKMADIVEKHGGQSEAELILCIEGDTKEKHFQTVSDMLNANYSFIRMYQFMMLPGTRSASKEHREKYGFQTKCRVLPRCFGTYRFRDEHFPSAEIEEIVIATNTMPHADYHDCRDLHMSVEIFNNDSIFFDLIQFLKFSGIPRIDFITATHRRILDKGGPLAKLYAEFRAEEEKNLWRDVDEVESFVKEDGVIDRYVDGEFGTNELYKYRALAVFEHIEALHEMAFGAARDLLTAQGAMTNEAGAYLDELSEFSLLRKSAPLETDRAEKRTFHFDFARLLEDRFRTHPSEVECPDGMEMEIFHTDRQKKLIDSYVNQYTTSLIGLGRILLRANMNRLYRTVRPTGGGAIRPPKEVLAKTDRLGGDQKA
ncbi:MAG: hypothetical protein CMM60_05745 [Rhodospirillaceae bacterium]|jgi:radical SAM superfamily enzyme YgiQ (UPF0313 family)|nr:hypothetical protein [Rhodospirillaceae bacterium]|tara:strand:- start:1439 stop:3541 length:2103 start_codon:yes stop_codon:yes gene_type:complete